MHAFIWIHQPFWHSLLSVRQYLENHHNCGSQSHPHPTLNLVDPADPVEFISCLSCKSSFMVNRWPVHALLNQLQYRKVDYCEWYYSIYVRWICNEYFKRYIGYCVYRFRGLKLIDHKVRLSKLVNYISDTVCLIGSWNWNYEIL